MVELRPELMPPALDEATVSHLAGLTAQIDGANPGQWEDELAEFNRLAGTAFEFIDFQGIYGGQDHNTWVRQVLGKPHHRLLPDITRAELVELTRRVRDANGEEHEIGFYLEMLALNMPDPQVSDLIFYPGDYFGHDVERDLSAEEIVDIALSRARGAGDRVVQDHP